MNSHVRVAQPAFLGASIKVDCLIWSLCTSLIVFQRVKRTRTIRRGDHMKYSIVSNVKLNSYELPKDLSIFGVENHSTYLVSLRSASVTPLSLRILFHFLSDK